VDYDRKFIKIAQAQGLGIHTDCTNSLNNFVRSHNGHAYLIEEDPSEPNLNERVLKSPIYQNSSYSIFGNTYLALIVKGNILVPLGMV